MINGKTVLAIIPARGGSKGILRKNIKILAGKPLIAWTIEEGKKSKYIDRLILSSEDDEIIQVAKEWGCEVPFVRPKELAADETLGIEPVIHAINTLQEKYDYVCLLQPTSPLRKVEHIDGCIEKLIQNNAKSCVSVTETDKHPYWMYEIDCGGKLRPMFPDKNVKRRQDLPKILVLNGAVFFCETKTLLNTKKLLNDDSSFYKISRMNSIDIDSDFEFEIAQYFLNKQQNKLSW